MTATDDHTIRQTGTPQQRRSRHGMTLLEVVLAMAILLSAVLWASLGILSAARANRIMSVQVAANTAIRHQAEEIMAVAADNTNLFSNGAMAVLNYYGGGGYATLNGTGEKDTLPIGPNGSRISKITFNTADNTLVGHFVVPAPGQNIRNYVDNGVLKVGDIQPDPTAIGQFVIYLDAKNVPPGPMASAMWQDLGATTNKRVSGFPMQRRKKLEQPVVPTSSSDFADPRNLGIYQVPIDITITHFNNREHQDVISTVTRRIIISEDTAPSETETPPPPQPPPPS